MLILCRDYSFVSLTFHFQHISKLTVVIENLFVCFMQQRILLFIFCWCILFQDIIFSLGKLNLLCFYDKRKINIANIYKFTTSYKLENKQLSLIMNNKISKKQKKILKFIVVPQLNQLVLEKTNDLGGINTATQS